MGNLCLYCSSEFQEINETINNNHNHNNDKQDEITLKDIILEYNKTHSHKESSESTLEIKSDSLDPIEIKNKVFVRKNCIYKL